MGLPHGLGIAEFETGAAYCGEWYLGDRHGYHALSFPLSFFALSPNPFSRTRPCRLQIDPAASLFVCAIFWAKVS